MAIKGSYRTKHKEELQKYLDGLMAAKSMSDEELAKHVLEGVK
jgi:ribosomal protein L29